MDETTQASRRPVRLLWARVIFLFLVAGWLVLWSRSRGPVVDGLTLDQWLEMSFEYEGGAYRGGTTPEFAQALNQLGDRAVPHLLARMKTRDWPWANWLSARLKPIPNDPRIHRLGLDRSFVAQQRAVNGFRALGGKAVGAVPELVKLRPGFAVRQAIDAIGPAAWPVLKDQALAGNLETRTHAMSLLEVGVFDSTREQVVEVWIQCLKDPAAPIRSFAAALLGNTSPARAEAAIAPLRQAVADPNPDVASAAKLALSKLLKAQ